MRSPTVRTYWLAECLFFRTLNRRLLLDATGYNTILRDDRVSTSSVYTVEVVEMLTACRSEPLPIWSVYTLFNGDEDAKRL